MAEMSSLEIPLMIRGYHEYQRIWSAAVGEELPCSREFGNVHDLFAVAVKRSGSVVVTCQKEYLQYVLHF